MGEGGRRDGKGRQEGGQKKEGGKKGYQCVGTEETLEKGMGEKILEAEGLEGTVQKRELENTLRCVS